MSCQRFTTNSYCVGGRHRSATTNVYGDITSKESKVLIGCCSICERKKSKRVSDKAIQAEGLGDFFKILGEKGLNVSKKMAKNVLRNPVRAFETGANVGTAFACRSPKAALSFLPEVNNFYHTGKRLYHRKFV